MPEDKAQPLLTARKIEKLGDCPVCHEWAWWVSIHGVLVCGIYHPSALGAAKKMRAMLKNLKNTPTSCLKKGITEE